MVTGPCIQIYPYHGNHMWGYIYKPIGCPSKADILWLYEPFIPVRNYLETLWGISKQIFYYLEPIVWGIIKPIVLCYRYSIYGTHLWGIIKPIVLKTDILFMEPICEELLNLLFSKQIFYLWNPSVRNSNAPCIVPSVRHLVYGPLCGIFNLWSHLWDIQFMEPSMGYSIDGFLYYILNLWTPPWIIQVMAPFIMMQC